MMTRSTYCPHCAQAVSVYEFQTPFGTNGVCPNCASRFDLDWIKRIDDEEAEKIIDSRLPLGRFIIEGHKGFEPTVGIDNSTGNAWTEDFEEIESCVRWLAGEEREVM